MATATTKRKRPRGTVHIITEDERVVAHLYIKHGSSKGATEAASHLKLTQDQVKALLKKPAVQRYLQNYNHAFLREMARYELSRVTRFSVTREDVIGRLHMLSLMPPEDTKGSIDGQVEALNAITEILGLKFSPRDADTFFANRTPEELRNYALYGKFDPTEEEKKGADAPPSESTDKS